MTDRRKTVGLIAITLALVLALVVSACGPAEEAEKERVVKVGLLGAFTGALATILLHVGEASIDYIEYINEQGGIDGVRLEVIWQDMGPAPVPRCIIGHKRLKDAGIVVEINQGSGNIEPIVPMAQKDEIPFVNQGYYTKGFVTEPLRWVFAGGPSFGTEFATFMKWVKDNWREPRPPRIGLVLYDHASGWDALGGADYAPELGIEFVGHEVVPFLGTVDTSTELLRLAAEKPDWVFAAVAAASYVTVVKDAARLRLQEKGIKLCSWVGGMDESILRIVGEDGEGWHVISYVSLPQDPRLPGARIIQEVAKKHRGWEPEEIPIIYGIGWLQGAVTVEAIRLAMEKVGFENLSGRAVRDALASIKGLDLELGPPITMSDDWPYFSSGFQMREVQRGRITPVSEWLEPAWFPDWAPRGGR